MKHGYSENRDVPVPGTYPNEYSNKKKGTSRVRIGYSVGTLFLDTSISKLPSFSMLKI